MSLSISGDIIPNHLPLNTLIPPLVHSYRVTLLHNFNDSHLVPTLGDSLHVNFVLSIAKGTFPYLALSVHSVS